MKKIIILGLLLIPSFSFAVNYVENLGAYEDLGGNNNCTINSDLSFDCSESNDVIVGTDTSWYKTSSSYFWTTSGLAVYIHQQNGNDIQGLITSFAIAGNEFPSYSRTISYDDFLTFYNEHELTNWSWSASVSTPGRAGPDFVFGDTHIFFYPITSSSFAGSITPFDFGLSGWGLEANYTSATNSPFQDNKTTQPTQQYTCPTAQQLINTYGQQYNTGLCYSSNIIYSGGTIQTVTPKTIFELYPTRIDLNQDIQNYNTYCNNVATQQACQTIFEGKNEEYTLIAKIPQDVMPMQLYAYCNLTLNMEPNQTTCTASTGTINNGIGINDIINNIGNTPITVITPGTPPEPPKEQGNENIYGSGSVFDKYKQAEDDIKRRNIIRKAEDTIQTMREIYTKLTGIFRARQGSNGIVPPLITGLIALIVLFKLFMK